MRVRMIIGEYEFQEPYALDIFLAPLEFPMQVERVDEVDLDHIPEGETEFETYLYSEAQLREWADVRFATYQIWDMEVPQAAMLEEERA